MYVNDDLHVFVYKSNKIYLYLLHVYSIFLFRPDTPHPCDAQIQQDYSVGGSSTCKLALQNPKTLIFRSENADIATFDLGDSENVSFCPINSLSSIATTVDFVGMF